MQRSMRLWLGVALIAGAALSSIVIAVLLARPGSSDDASLAVPTANAVITRERSLPAGAATPDGAVTAGEAGERLPLEVLTDRPPSTRAEAQRLPAVDSAVETPRQRANQTGAAGSGPSGSSAGSSAAVLPGLASSDTPSSVVARIRVPAAGIDARVVTGQLSARTGDMLAPRGPSAVAWYPYSAAPGAGGNAVFSGHVDYVRIGPAVFWNLRRLQPGDTITVEMTSGTTLRYRVEFSRAYGAGSGPWSELFHPVADNDVLTLYTCDGTFSGGDYSQRRVVRATRVS